MTNYSISDAVGAVASTVADADNVGVSLGTEFYVTSTCWLTDIRWWQATTGSPSSANRTLAIYTADSDVAGTMVAGPFTSTPSGVGPQDFVLPTPLSLIVNQRYRVVVFHPAGKYVANSGIMGNGGVNFVSGPLVVPCQANAVGTDQGSYFYSGSISYTTDWFSNAFYWSGAIVTDVDPTVQPAPKVLLANDGYLLNQDGGKILL